MKKTITLLSLMAMTLLLAAFSGEKLIENSNDILTVNKEAVESVDVINN